jgi:chromosome segregation ATPase
LIQICENTLKEENNLLLAAGTARGLTQGLIAKSMEISSQCTLAIEERALLLKEIRLARATVTAHLTHANSLRREAQRFAMTRQGTSTEAEAAELLSKELAHRLVELEEKNHSLVELYADARKEHARLGLVASKSLQKLYELETRSKIAESRLNSLRTEAARKLRSSDAILKTITLIDAQTDGMYLQYFLVFTYF